jgi:hypothetical protein
MPKKVMQVKGADGWETLGRVTEEGARKFVELTEVGRRIVEANPIDHDGVEVAGRMMTVSASYVRNNADCCRIVPEGEAKATEKADDSGNDEPEEAPEPKKKAAKKKKKPAGDE